MTDSDRRGRAGVASGGDDNRRARKRRKKASPTIQTEVNVSASSATPPITAVVTPTPSTPRQDALACLPSAVLVHMATFLFPEDVAVALTLCSRSLREQMRSPVIWRPLFHRVWPITCEHKSHDWHKTYTLRMRLFRRGNTHLCTACGCSKGYKTVTGLVKHQASGHKVAEDLSHACSECNERFRTPGELVIHASTHTGTRRFPCPHSGCTRSFHYKYELRNHAAVHTGEDRKHPCKHQGCGSSFKSRSALLKHTRNTHNKERVQCALCSLFLTSEAMPGHIALKHDRSQLRFRCGGYTHLYGDAALGGGTAVPCETGFFCANRLVHHLKQSHNANASLTHKDIKQGESN